MKPNRIFGHLITLAIFVSLSACAITRYYPTGDLNGQLAAMRTLIDSNLAKVNADFDEKRKFIEGAKKSGADLTQAPFPAITESFTVMTKSREQTFSESVIARSEIDAFTSSIAGRDRITSDDPAYSKIQSFEKTSEKMSDRLGKSFKAYQEVSNHFTAVAKESRLLPVDVASFDAQLKTTLSEIDRQCGLVEKKLPEAEKAASTGDPSKREARKSLLVGMREDVAKIRGTQGELEAFRSSFLIASKGQKSYLVSPKHPQYELFQSLNGVRDRANAAATAFNAKVDALQKI